MSKEAPKILLSPSQRVVAYAERLTLPELVRRGERLNETISRKEKALTAMTAVAIPDLKTALRLARERETLNLLRLFAGAIVNVELRRHVEATGLSQEEAAPFIKDLKELGRPVEVLSGIGTKEPVVGSSRVEIVIEKKPERVTVPRVAKPKGETKGSKARERKAPTEQEVTPLKLEACGHTLIIDQTAKKVTFDGKEIKLSPNQFVYLRLLFDKKGGWVTLAEMKKCLLPSVRKQEEVEPWTVTEELRGKLGDLKDKKIIIVSGGGQGARYRLGQPGGETVKGVKTGTAIEKRNSPIEVHTRPEILKIIDLIVSDPNAYFDDFKDLFGKTSGKKLPQASFRPTHASYALYASLRHLFLPKGNLNEEEQATLTRTQDYMRQKNIQTWQEFHKVVIKERLFPSLPITSREGAVFVSYYICARHEAIAQLGAEAFPTDITEALFNATQEGLGAGDLQEQGNLLERLRESSKRKIMGLVESFDKGQIKFIPNENLNFLLLYIWFYQDRLRPVIEGEIVAKRATGADTFVLGLTRQLLLAGPEQRRILLAEACLDEKAAALLKTGAGQKESVSLVADETKQGAKEKLIVLRGFTLNEVRGVFDQVLKKVKSEDVNFPLETERAKALFPELRGNFLLKHRDLMPHKHTDEETSVEMVGQPNRDGLRRKGFHSSSPLVPGREKLLVRKEKETMLLDLDSIVWSLIIHSYKAKGQPLTNDEAKVVARIVTSMKFSRDGMIKVNN